ncbi:UNVERIFIED_CONTAM: GNAT family N-acetyltransferase [Halobacillus marinus]|uniref:GNAT family N-acetyltransferase n=1 Tax=Halobacillus sp. BAB-2008 TaxID=1246484 RepID=UPI0002A4FB6B|nr:GNAT family N-acetyltransferase [Halobacillus sp. BAB-2008]ELK45448.1 GCN5-like N-acetyltransferase [Halobacillus sp. BAB-2008]
MKEISMVKFTEGDFSDYFRLVSDVRVMAQITERAIPEEEARSNFDKLLKRNADGTSFGSYKVYDSSGGFLGLAHLTRSVEKQEEAEIGYMIVPDCWGLGYGSRIAGRLITMAENQGLERLTAVIDPKNTASKRILTKQGFVSVYQGTIDGLPGEILHKELLSIDDV